MLLCDDYEANWNRQAGRQAGAQDHVLSQADALTKKLRDVQQEREVAIFKQVFNK